MAITDIIEESSMIDTGAPSIKYEGERPLKKPEMLMAGPDWYLKRMQLLMDEYGYDYDEAGEIAYDSDKYYEVIGIDPGGMGDESRIMEQGIPNTKIIKNQPHMLAYITPGEADTLKDLGGQETMTEEGVPAFPYQDWEGYSSPSKSSKPTPSPAETNRERGIRAHATTGSSNIHNVGKAEDPYIMSGGDRHYQGSDTYEKEIKKSQDIVKAHQDKTPFVHPTRKVLYDVFPNNPGNELRYIQHLKTNNPVAYGKLPPELRALYEETETGGDMDTRSYKDFDKFSFDDFESLRTFDPSKYGLDAINFADYAAKYRGAPGLKYSGNVGNLEKFVETWTIHPVTGKKIPATYGYKEKTGDGPDEPEWRRLGYSSQDEYERSRGGGSGGGGGGSDDDDEDDWYMPLAFRAEGGRVGRAYGGIMGDDGRRAYGLGSIFKKIKKVFKSPIGKAALLGLGGYKMGIFGGGGKNFKMMEMIMGKGGKGGLWNWAKANPFAAISGASALSGLMAAKDYKKYDDWNNEDDGTGLGDLNQYRQYGIQAFAEGGKPEAGLMDMGGMEKDYREEGGFVPIGGKEKADDVPARLSKNEFVFTADAVRGAGEGDIDKGAEVMYNMMKNLEAGGQVSEESQGLDGAREMFQTSQRLEEVL
jgi:hypothetical protein